MAHRIANQHGLSLVPYGGQTYRAWKERQVAQVADRESRPGYTGKPAHWQLTSRQLVLFSMHGVTPGLRFEKLGIKEQRIGFYLLGHTGAAGEFRRRVFDGFTRSGYTFWHPHLGILCGGK